MSHDGKSSVIPNFHDRGINQQAAPLCISLFLSYLKPAGSFLSLIKRLAPVFFTAGKTTNKFNLLTIFVSRQISISTIQRDVEKP